MSTIKTFRDLEVWRKAHDLVLLIYAITKSFPTDERYGLVSQLRRAALSVATNIVEGFKRRSVNDSLHFYNMSEASLEEVKYELMVSRDLRYINNDIYQQSNNLAEEVSRLLYGWRNSQRCNARN